MARTLAALALVGAIGCGAADPEPDALTPADLSDAETVATLIRLGSTPALFDLLVEQVPIYAYDNCPARTGGLGEDGLGELTLTGGCTDGAGVEWTGEAHLIRRDDGSAEYTITALATKRTVPCPGGSMVVETRATGELTLARNGAIQSALQLTRHEDDGNTCTPADRSIEFRYEAQVEGDPFGTGRTVWTGAGWLRATPIDRVEVATDTEVLDEAACTHEPLSGWSSLRDDGRLARVAYDGFDDCDSAATAHWTLDGVDMGTLTGIRR